jgi:hypothetical protein
VLCTDFGKAPALMRVRGCVGVKHERFDVLLPAEQIKVKAMSVRRTCPTQSAECDNVLTAFGPFRLLKWAQL